MKNERKKTFLLLEVLIALALVTTLALPMATLPLRTLRAEQLKLEKLERRRLATLSFAEVREQFLNREISWEMIPHEKNETKGPYPLPPVELHLPGFPPQRLERSFKITCAGESDGTHEESYRSLKVSLFLTPSLPKEEYTFKAIVCQKWEEG